MNDPRTVPPKNPREYPGERAWRAHFQHTAFERQRFTLAADYLRKDIIATLMRAIPSDASVLEVGFGSGETLAALPNRVRHGLDYTASAVTMARERYPELELFEADALNFHRPERYDAIVCDRIVHSVPDIQRLLENLSGHLAPGGRIFLTCFSYLWELALRAGEIAGFKLPTPEGNWLSDFDLDHLFTIADVDVVRYEDRLLLPLPIPGADGLINRYVAKLPFVHHLALYRMYVLRRRVEPAPLAPTVSVVVPARNEEGNVAAALARTPVMGSRTELIFVEGGSSDGTRAAIEKALREYQGPLEVSFRAQPGKGKGDAVREGFSHAKGDILMILDADLTVEPEDLPKFYDVLVRGIADYAHGTRLVYPMESRAMRFLNKLGNMGFSRLFTYLLNQPIRDTLCGTKVLWARDYERIAVRRSFFGDFDPFGDFDLIFGAARLNLKLIEIPIRYRDRTYGETNISRFRHGWMLLQMSAVAARKIKFV